MAECDLACQCRVGSTGVDTAKATSISRATEGKYFAAGAGHPTRIKTHVLAMVNVVGTMTEFAAGNIRYLSDLT